MTKSYKTFTACLSVFVLIYIGLIQLIPLENAANLGYGGGARLFPWLVGVALLALIGYDFKLTAAHKEKNKAAADKAVVAAEKKIEKEGNTEGVQTGKGFLVLLIAGLILVYQVLIGLIGFIPSTIPFLFTLFRLFKVKSWPLTILMSLVFPIIFYFVFEELFGVRLDFMSFRL